VGRDKLKIFISGKEDELYRERGAIQELIENLRFEAICSENRPASDMSMEYEYRKEVLDSDIYIGIFGKLESQASIKEFEIARANHTPILVFSMELDEEPDQMVAEFLHDIKKPSSGKVVPKFKTVNELTDKIHNSLIALVSREFKKAARITPESSKRLEQVHYEHQLIGMPLGTGEIIDWKLSSPSTMNRAQEYTVSATVKGEGDYFFITLLLVDPDKNQQWFVDNETINLELDTGKLNLEPNKEYSNSWTFPIFAVQK
jgi:Domain of unknown function (DUF4062)